MTKQKKHVQKFTDMESLKTPDQVKEYIDNNPDLLKPLRENLSMRLMDSYDRGLGNDYEVVQMLCVTTDNADNIADIMNTTYQSNHRIITSYIHNHILETRCFPSMTAIVKETKLSRQTVYNHLKGGLNNKSNALVKGLNEIMSQKALEKLYLFGIEDRNSQALKHYVQLSRATNNTSTTNNFIQINNLKISNDDFNNLPIEDMLEIECIVSKSILKNE